MAAGLAGLAATVGVGGTYMIMDLMKKTRVDVQQVQEVIGAVEMQIGAINKEIGAVNKRIDEVQEQVENVRDKIVEMEEVRSAGLTNTLIQSGVTVAGAITVGVVVFVTRK